MRKKEDSQMISPVEARLETHEAVCAQRYAYIELQFRSSNSRLKRIGQVLVGCCGFIIALLLTLVLKL